MRCKHVPCGKLFSGFNFSNIRAVEPPDKKGVYAIRVVVRGEQIESIIKKANQLTGRLNFPIVSNFIADRIGRLGRINQCPIIYIGSAGSRAGSRNTLNGRYNELAGRHTIMYPLWALLYCEWQLEYGYIVARSPANDEYRLKEEYKKIHGGDLPALVSR